MKVALIHDIALASYLIAYIYILCVCVCRLYLHIVYTYRNKLIQSFFFFVKKLTFSFSDNEDIYNVIKITISNKCSWFPQNY